MNAKAQRLLAAADGLPAGATVVEIGCVRSRDEIASDGHSTVYLAAAADANGWDFHSIDSDHAAVLVAQALVADTSAVVHEADGEAWLLLQCPADIDLLYLDGSASAAEAVDQYQAAPLAARSTVVIDDVQPIHLAPRGKGDSLIDVLIADGFDVVIHDTEPGYRMAVATKL